MSLVYCSNLSLPVFLSYSPSCTLIVTCLCVFPTHLRTLLTWRRAEFDFPSLNDRMQTANRSSPWSRAVWSQHIYTTTPFCMSLEKELFVSLRVFVYRARLLCICKVTTWRSGTRKITSCILWCSLFSIYGERKDFKPKCTCPHKHTHTHKLEHANTKSAVSFTHTHINMQLNTHICTKQTLYSTHVRRFVLMACNHKWMCSVSNVKTTTVGV